MDEYGVFEATNSEDYVYLAAHLKANSSIVFGWSRDKVSAYVVTMVRNPAVLGVLPFGGNPGGCIFVAVLGFGGFWFNPEHPPAAGYIEEKLRLSKGSAEDLAVLLNGVFEVVVNHG